MFSPHLSNPSLSTLVYKPLSQHLPIHHCRPLSQVALDNCHSDSETWWMCSPGMLPGPGLPPSLAHSLTPGLPPSLAHSLNLSVTHSPSQKLSLLFVTRAHREHELSYYHLSLGSCFNHDIFLVIQWVSERQVAGKGCVSKVRAAGRHFFYYDERKFHYS